MDPFLSCRKASKGRPLQAAASGWTAGVGPWVVVGGGEAAVVAATVLKVGGRVVGVISVTVTVVTASVTSSVSSKVSPRATEQMKVLSHEALSAEINNLQTPRTLFAIIEIVYSVKWQFSTDFS